MKLRIKMSDGTSYEFYKENGRGAKFETLANAILCSSYQIITYVDEDNNTKQVCINPKYIVTITYLGE